VLQAAHRLIDECDQASAANKILEISDHTAKDLLDRNERPRTIRGQGSRQGCRDWTCKWPKCGKHITRRPNAVSHLTSHVEYKPFRCEEWSVPVILSFAPTHPLFSNSRFRYRHDYKRHSRQQHASAVAIPLLLVSLGKLALTPWSSSHVVLAGTTRRLVNGVFQSLLTVPTRTNLNASMSLSKVRPFWIYPIFQAFFIRYGYMNSLFKDEDRYSFLVCKPFVPQPVNTPPDIGNWILSANSVIFTLYCSVICCYDASMPHINSRPVLHATCMQRPLISTSLWNTLEPSLFAQSITNSYS